MGKPTKAQLEAMHAAIMQNALEGNVKSAARLKAIYEAATAEDDQDSKDDTK